jgi:uncharacterized membrane protein YedE/YeeE
MNQKQQVRWERTRAKGMWRFVLIYGVLIWGGSMCIVTSLLATVINGRDNLTIRVPVFLVSGLVFGFGCWFVGEYLYRKNSTSDLSKS